MKILLDCVQLLIGGSIQVGLATLEKSSKTPEHEWHVVISDIIKKQINPSILKSFKSVKVIPLSSGFDRIRLSWMMPGEVRRHKPDVVFTVFGPSYWNCSVPHLQGFAHPQMIYPHINSQKRIKFRPFSDQILNPIKVLFFRRSDYLVVETETVRERASKYLNFPIENIFVVQNSYSPLFKKAIFRTPKKTKKNHFSFFIPSSYYMHKNLDSIPFVANELRKITKQSFKFILLVPKDSKGWKKIEICSEKLGVSKYLRTVGSVPHEDIACLYRESDAVLLPTFLECSTAVFPETFMARLPLATSNLDFARELCGDGALYFDPFSPSDIATKLNCIMNDSKLRKTLVSNGIKTLKEKYPSPEKKWENLLDVIIKVGKSNRK